MKTAGRMSASAAALVLLFVTFIWWRHHQRLPNEPFLQYLGEEWQTWRSGDPLDRESRLLSGSRAIDCGRTPLGADPRKVNDCALAAFSKSRPFRARWELMGIDGEVWDAIVTTPEGRVFQLQFLVGPFVPGARLVQKYECPQPVTLMRDAYSLICFRP